MFLGIPTEDFITNIMLMTVHFIPKFILELQPTSNVLLGKRSILRARTCTIISLPIEYRSFLFKLNSILKNRERQYFFSCKRC